MLKMVIAVLMCIIGVVFILPLAVTLLLTLVAILLKYWWIPFALLLIAYILNKIEE